MQRHPRRDTQPELRIRRELHRRGLRYRVHVRPLPELRRVADIVFRPTKVAVFIDGCYWHGCPVHGTTPKSNTWYWPAKIKRNRDRDADTDARLSVAGWVSVRVWEHEDPTEAAQRIEALVRGKAGGPARSTWTTAQPMS